MHHVIIQPLVLDNAVRAVNRRACFHIIRFDGEGVFGDVYHRIGRAPCLAARRNVVLLLRDQIVKLRPGCRVGRHIEYAFRVVEYALLHVCNRIAQVLGFIVVFEVSIFQSRIQ